MINREKEISSDVKREVRKKENSSEGNGKATMIATGFPKVNL